MVLAVSVLLGVVPEASGGRARALETVEEARALVLAVAQTTVVPAAVAQVPAAMVVGPLS